MFCTVWFTCCTLDTACVFLSCAPVFPGRTVPGFFPGCWGLNDRLLAFIALILATLGFLAGGLGGLLRHDWWSAVTAGSAVFSSVIFILFWDGKLQALSEQGGLGVLINLAVLAVVQVVIKPA